MKRRWHEGAKLQGEHRLLKSAAEVAAAFGLKKRSVEEHYSELPRRSDSQFCTQMLGRWFDSLNGNAEAERDAGSRPAVEVPSDWKARKDRAAALKAELELEERRGDLVLRSSAQEAMVSLVDIMAAQAASAPDLWAPQLEQLPANEIKARLHGLFDGIFKSMRAKLRTVKIEHPRAS